MEDFPTLFFAYFWLTVDGIIDSGCEIEQTPGDDEGQGSLMDCPPWGCKELDTTDEHQGTTILFALSRTH